MQTRTINLDVNRHMELFNPYKFETPVHVIGVGATGSWLTLQLAKLGITDITIWDYDMVEEHNVPNQAFGRQDIGLPKVQAVEQLLLRDCLTQVKVKNKKFTDQRLSGIVFLMVDSMEQRKLIWENSIKMKQNVKLLVEPRMGLDVGRVYNVNPMDLNHIKEYENTYYSDDVAEVSSCGTSMTVITTAMATASWCTRQLINYVEDGFDLLDNEILIDYKYNNIFPTKW